MGLGLESVMKAASESLELVEETLPALVLEEKITSAIVVALVEEVISKPETEEVTVAEPVEKAAEVDEANDEVNDLAAEETEELEVVRVFIPVAEGIA